MTKTVVLVDDHPLLRQGVRALLEPELDVVEAASAAEGLERIDAAPPDVAVIDVRLPDGDGIELVRTIRRRHPSVGCVVLTSLGNEDVLYEAAAAGAAAFVVKDAPGSQLADAIRRVADGEQLITDDAVNQLRARTAEQDPPSDPLLDQLSPQERRVVMLVVDGMTNKEAAEELGLAETTVRNYLSTVLRKLNLKNRTELAAYVTRVRVRDRREQPRR